MVEAAGASGLSRSGSCAGRRIIKEEGEKDKVERYLIWTLHFYLRVKQIKG